MDVISSTARLNDVINGCEGKDTLWGGTGRDSFAFSTMASKARIHRICDFKVADDSTYPENAVFKALYKKGSVTKPMAIKKDNFHVGAKAHDEGGYVVNDKKTGALYYDADGTGLKGQVQTAALSKNLKLTHKDLYVI